MRHSGKRVGPAQRPGKTRQFQQVCVDEAELRHRLSQLLEQDNLDDCLIDVPRRLLSVRYVSPTGRPPQDA